MISPYQAVEELSFDSPSRKSPLNPRASPPSSAPPPPPPADENRDNHHDPLQQPSTPTMERNQVMYKSYQHDNDEQSSATSSRAVQPPTIRHDDENTSQNYSWARRIWRGDVNLRPNIGLTNVYDTAVCDLPVHTAVQQMHAFTAVLAGMTILLVTWTWWIRLLTLKWAKLVVSLFLAFLACLLGFTEVMALIQGVRTTTSSTGAVDEDTNLLVSVTGVQHHYSRLQDQFGFLYHPVGKPCLLIFMATLCLAMGGLWEWLLGACYLLVAVILICMGQQAEFQRLYYPPQLDEHEDITGPSPEGRSWSYFGSSFHSQEESRSLISNIVRPQVTV